MSEQITLYTAKICPWAHRVELALEESNLSYKRFEVDLGVEADWYAPSDVPAIAYGGPDVKITESAVLIEFIADLAPEATLLPKDPFTRAKARFFIETVTPRWALVYTGALKRGADPAAAILPILETIQNLLPEEGYAVGEWSIADTAVLPFFARLEVALKNDIGKYEVGQGIAAWEKITSDPKYARYRKYYADLKTRDSFKRTFHEDLIKATFTKRFART